MAAFGDFLLELRERLDLTVLLVEHHMGLVMRVSETVHVLDFGKTIARGSPDEVRADPAVIEAYLGTPEEARPRRWRRCSSWTASTPATAASRRCTASR